VSLRLSGLWVNRNFSRPISRKGAKLAKKSEKQETRRARPVIQTDLLPEKCLIQLAAIL